MCLAAFALNAHPRFPVVIAANRDEFFARPAAPMAWWRAGETDLLSGRDLQAGGTWFGLTRSGRLALLTNVREPGRQVADAPSRGDLVVDWLTGSADAAAFVQTLRPGYNGFNLVMADLARGTWHWHSNRAPSVVALPDGVHGLSNALLDTPWPKTVGLKADVAAALASATSADALMDALLIALADGRRPPDEALPDTGVGLAREQQLSPRFVRMTGPDGAEAVYGTRCSTVLVIEALAEGRRRTRVLERTVDALGRWQPPVRHTLP